MLEAAIHEILADETIADAVALAALLATDRIVTGINHDRSLPYGSISIDSNLAEYRSNCGALRKPRVRFQVWHETHALGAAIQEAIQTLFENKTFTTASQKLVSTRHENSLSIQEPDGVWQFITDIEIIT